MDKFENPCISGLQVEGMDGKDRLGQVAGTASW